MASIDDVIAHLAQDPLRNIVLLKHLEAFPEHTRVHHFAGEQGSATLVLLKTAASAYDRATYPQTQYAALISSDDATLTGRLLDAIPPDAGVVFKVGRPADREVIAVRFAARQTAEF